MLEYDQKLMDVLALLPENWRVDDYQLADMGWAAMISNGEQVMTLHSERGWVDVYQGRFTEQKSVGCKQHANEIAGVISIHLA
jgi:hypothetical protein